MNYSSPKLIFIVDDDPDDSQFISEAFVEYNNTFHYEFIRSADQLLKELNNPDSKKPDLILLDLNMPGVMGLQALKEIRSNKSFNQIPVIVLTTSSLEKDRAISYEYGANCFLTKSHSYKRMIIIAKAIIDLWLVENHT
jgi:chemotaxis family two-component system response regulator Rcp1